MEFLDIIKYEDKLIYLRNLGTVRNIRNFTTNGRPAGQVKLQTQAPHTVLMENYFFKY